jgi:hypothetical protein
MADPRAFLNSNPLAKLLFSPDHPAQAAFFPRFLLLGARRANMQHAREVR